jgi:hypothetical protein
MQISLKLGDAASYEEATQRATLSYNYVACPAPPGRVAELLNAQFNVDFFVSGGVNGKLAFVNINWPRDRATRKPVKMTLQEGIELDVQPVRTFRASGDCICDVCGKEYRQHPVDEEQLSYTGDPFLIVLCSGDRVKL